MGYADGVAYRRIPMKPFPLIVYLLSLIAALIFLFGVFRAVANAAELSVREGNPAPDFTLPDQEGRPITLSEQRGKWVVLYFYPKDDTPGCTKEACSFRDNLLAIQQLDAVVLGVSVDSVASHKKFADKFNLNFPILADDRHRVTSEYGVLTSFMGMKVARRSTLIIDPEGIVRKVFPSVKPEDHAPEIHRALLEIQDSANTTPKS